MSVLFTKCNDYIIRAADISEEDKDIIKYGLRQLPLILSAIFSFIMIAIVIGKMGESVLYIAAFCSIRVYAGGYHASTQLRCYAISVFTVVDSLLIIKYMNINDMICICSIILLCVVIAFFSPVQDLNKPLDDIERKVYKKRAIVIMVGWCIFSILLFILGLDKLLNCVFNAMVQLLFFVLAGIIKSKYTS